MTAAEARVVWHLDREPRRPFGTASPDPDRFEMLGFPPPWDDRPWVFAMIVASTDGAVAWQRRGPADDPVRAILGDPRRPDRLADLRQMRLLRAFGDVGIGAQTLREQPRLVQTCAEPGEPPDPALYGFRERHGLTHHPRVVVYSLYGRLPREHPTFNTPGVEPIVVTTEVGVAELERRGFDVRRLAPIVEPLLEPAGLERAHRRLFAERGVRYLDCEGGMTVLRALHGAGVLDEVFLTTTDVVVGTDGHDGVQTTFDFEREGATLLAEGRTAAGAYRFHRWRFNQR